MVENFYRALYRIRRVEQEIARVYPTDIIKSPIHLSIGQEAVSVGVCEALQPSDVVFGTYRSHALYLAKGGDLKKLISELYGKVTGCAKGKGGSMHLIDTAAGFMGTSAVVGTTIPLAVGYAYALKQSGKDSIVASFFGDGAVEEGVFHETLNFAALKGVPILFICENNGYAINSHQSKRQPMDNICERARVYGMPAERIEDNDIFEIYERVERASSEIRNGREGPRLFECMTYRWREHVGPNEDFDAGYRSRSEAQPWFESDPLKTLGASLEIDRRGQIEVDVEAEIYEAFVFAEESPFPDEDELYTDVFTEA
ncbi:MAG: thiamine pyrophosphate-dependent dehydrogenase E1 component subunit alpha [Candidatus Poribacteria bacterium]|nr:thiamine pyrophosphate-dependent dehydrogenase E1 component subunit alpha [Candidatus Poribacteria bacterium]